jgi:hypothetical protein
MDRDYVQVDMCTIDEPIVNWLRHTVAASSDISNALSSWNTMRRIEFIFSCVENTMYCSSVLIWLEDFIWVDAHVSIKCNMYEETTKAFIPYCLLDDGFCLISYLTFLLFTKHRLRMSHVYVHVGHHHGDRRNENPSSTPFIHWFLCSAETN